MGYGHSAMSPLRLQGWGLCWVPYPLPSTLKKHLTSFWVPQTVSEVGQIMAPQNIHLLIPRSCEVYLIWQRKRGRCDEIQDFEVGRLSWITPVGLKGNHRCPYKRMEGMWWQEQGLESLPHAPRSAHSRRAGRGEEQNRPWALRRTSRADTFIYPEKLISIFWPSELCKDRLVLL